MNKKKIESKKYESSIQSKATINNIVHTRSENQKQFQIKTQPKETQVHFITQNKYERKFVPSKILNKTSITNSSYSNTNSQIFNYKKSQIYGTWTTSSIINKALPELKYYARFQIVDIILMMKALLIFYIGII